MPMTEGPRTGRRADVGVPVSAPVWRPPALSGPVVFVVMVLGYLSLAQLVMWLNDPVENGASLWPAAGLTLGALLLLPHRSWGWVLGAVFVAELGGDLAWGYPALASVGWALSNALEPLLAATLLRRFAGPGAGLVPLRRLMLFLGFGVVTGPLAGATLATVAWAATGGGQLFDMWLRYLVGDALGVLVVAPVLLGLRTPRTRRPWLETAALAASSTTVTVAVFGGWAGSWVMTMPYLLIPFFAWGALRYGVRGTSLLAVVVTLLANWFTVLGHGPFADAGGSDGYAVVLLQVFLGITVSTALVLASLVSDLRNGEQVQAALRHQANHDALTKLPNRGSLAVALQAALATHDRADCRPALLVLDLDGLKAVNDRFGHRGGDELLVEVAARITSCVRAGDIAARISGDEFVVLLTDADDTVIRSVASRIVERVAAPVELGTRGVVTPSISVGAAVARQDDDAESVFRAADEALYQAKRHGRGRVVHVDDRLRRRASERSRTEEDLPKAFDLQQIRCRFQPQADLRDGVVAGFESVPAWLHPERGELAAEQFQAAVEATGYAARLFQLVLDQSLAAQSRLATELGFRPSMAVNLSAVQAGAPYVVPSVLAALSRAEAPADRLSIEVTTGSPLDESGTATLRELHAAGVRLVLDGFGTGAASVTVLSAIPWQMVKLDPSFVSVLDRNAGSRHVVRAMMSLADALGIETLADGVSTSGQLELAAELGCAVAQGPLLGEALPFDEALQRAGDLTSWVLPSAAVTGRS